MVIFLLRYRITGMLSLLLLTSQSIHAQNNGLLQRTDLADVNRFYQLTDSVKAKELGVLDHSFSIRPLRPVIKKQDPAYGLWLDQVSLSNYYNDSLATGYNNGSFFQATGWQQRFSVGVKARLGNLHIDLQPELILAQNKVPATIHPSFSEANFFSRYYFMNINVIDLPSRFGTQSLTKLFPGQSSIKYHFKQLAFGISSENLWWGPGIRNSLVLTNQAPGFLHATLQTIEPIRTRIGSFEAQMIYGTLDSSGIEPVENVRQFANFWRGAYEPKISQSKRGIAGMVFTWQPKWIKHLYLGFASSFYFYHKKSDTAGKAFPDYSHTVSRQDQYSTGLGSLFFRYAMPDDHAEIYAEVGRADKPATLFNLFGDTVPLAYTAGLRKFIPLKKSGQYIELAAEITHLQLPDPRLIFNAAAPYSIPKTRSWYTHPRIRQGYTHYGQSLGAGIGPGSNSQSANISWTNGINKLGLHFERVIHNNDFYYYQYIGGSIGAGTADRYWTDLSYGLHGQWSYKDFLFALALTSTSALNYMWVKVDGTFTSPSRLSDKRNVQVALSIRYALNKSLVGKKP